MTVLLAVLVEPVLEPGEHLLERVGRGEMCCATSLVWWLLRILLVIAGTRLSSCLLLYSAQASTPDNGLDDRRRCTRPTQDSTRYFPPPLTLQHRG